MYLFSVATCRFLDADGLHEAAVDLAACVLEVHVGLLRRHPLHPVLAGEGHRVLDLQHGKLNYGPSEFSGRTSQDGLDSIGLEYPHCFVEWPTNLL